MGIESAGTPAEGAPFEQRLAEDPRWALSEGSRFLEGKGAVHQALHKIAKRLDDAKIPYAVVGGMALFRHGFRRFTEDVDILLTRESLRKAHKHLDGRGYVPPFTGSKNLRDVELRVALEFLVTNDYPGDGKPKPVSFPDPASVAVEHEGIKYVRLAVLVELKIASGMTDPGRLKDLADVQELIKVLGLPPGFAEELDPYVRAKYLELWEAARSTDRRFMDIWRNKFLTLDAQSIDDMIAVLQEAADTLKAMRADGVVLDPAGGTADDYAYLVTTDPEIAKKYGMHPEDEFWDEDAGDEEGSEDPPASG